LVLVVVAAVFKFESDSEPLGSREESAQIPGPSFLAGHVKGEPMLHGAILLLASLFGPGVIVEGAGCRQSHTARFMFPTLAD
jgi:hypothetical protein